jgi:hypothetical protein
MERGIAKSMDSFSTRSARLVIMLMDAVFAVQKSPTAAASISMTASIFPALKGSESVIPRLAAAHLLNKKMQDCAIRSVTLATTEWAQSVGERTLRIGSVAAWVQLSTARLVLTSSLTK